MIKRKKKVTKVSVKRKNPRATLASLAHQIEQLQLDFTTFTLERNLYNPLNSRCTVSQVEAARQDQKDRTREMFEALDDIRLGDSTQEFIDDLRHGYEIYGFLTVPQYKCLERNYKRFINGVRFKV